MNKGNKTKFRYDIYAVHEHVALATLTSRDVNYQRHCLQSGIRYHDYTRLQILT
ncbi:unnamed protein product [Ixodes pacificus]